MKVFPAADLFPMLPADELEQLAADIKTHGQRDPIVVAMVDGEEMLVDGRNRLAACKMAGVEPTVRRLNGEDPKAFVVSVNINRRHMTKGERAMAVAMIYPEPEKGGRGKKAVKITEFSGSMLSHARTVLAHTPDMAKAVLAGKPLAEAYARALEVKAEGETEGARITRLRIAAPDLAERVDAGTLELAEAVTLHIERWTKARADEENRREAYLRTSQQAYQGIAAWGNAEFVRGVEERLADHEFRAAFIARVRPLGEDAALFIEGAEALGRVLARLNKGDAQ